MHGDLWTFNLLVTRGKNGPAITGLLDADRAWWGDPMADWIMFLLDIRQDDPDWQARLAAFDAGYGTFDGSEATHFRREIYKAMHICSATIWHLRNGNEASIARARRELAEIVQTLTTLL